ncbi:MAG: GDSL family lipase [Oscillospiraceae bacterium]|nr:GDSL family lipase [Oscillospiraceae bacterium]
MNFKCDEKYVTVHGRTLVIDGIRYIDYSCSGAAFVFTGRSVRARLTSDYKPDPALGDVFMPCCAVLVDGRVTKRFELPEKDRVYELYSSDEERTVTIELMKMSECAFGKVGIVEFITDTDKVSPAPKSGRRIEFVGDSITCGYGIEGKLDVDVFNTKQENPLSAYASQTARRFGAEYNLIAWSGIGVYSSWVEENAEKPLDNWLSPVLYPCADAALCNDLHREPFDEWDFSSFVPQVIVINLGTNDESFTKHIPEREARFRELYLDYMKLIRKKNPDAEMICSYGIMENGLCAVIEDIVRELSQTDRHIHYLRYTTHTAENDGMAVDYHPSQKSHDRMCEELTAKIAEITGWDHT